MEYRTSSSSCLIKGANFGLKWHLQPRERSLWNSGSMGKSVRFISVLLVSGVSGELLYSRVNIGDDVFVITSLLQFIIYSGAYYYYY